MNNRLPTGIQDFEKLRDLGLVYIDKTAVVWHLAQSSSPIFLSRPRRFGKSLLVSVLKYYWQGRRDLFEGLDICALEDAKPEPWAKHAVLHLDLGNDNYALVGALEQMLNGWLAEHESVYGCSGNEDEKLSFAGRFLRLIKAAERQSKRRVVVLVDEYDKPLLDAMDNVALVEHNRAILKGLYGVLKSGDAHLRFIFVTGVTRFTKVSIFSDLNNLDEITLTKDYATLCGITEAELARDLMSEVDALALSENKSRGETLTELASNYDGYCFRPDGPDSPGATRVYNPYSLMKALKFKQYSAWWFATGTPTFLVKRIRKARLQPQRLVEGGIYATEGQLENYMADNPDPVPMLFQTGYLTICGYDKRRGRYSLCIPNQEVRMGLFEGLLMDFAPIVGGQNGCDIYALDDCLESGDTDGVRNILCTLFASISYSSAKEERDPFENCFQAVIYITFTLLGRFAQIELHTAHGRIDVVVETPHWIWVMELKRDGTTAEALEQIEGRGYCDRFAADSRTLIRVGCVFDSTSRLLTAWESI